MENENKNILEVIFNAREDEIASINNEDEEYLQKNNMNVWEKRGFLDQELDKILDKKPEIQERIKKNIDDYMITVNNESGYFCKKYYIEGMKDGIKLIMQCLK